MLNKIFSFAIELVVLGVLGYAFVATIIKTAV
jgi:hypothetical protein